MRELYNKEENGIGKNRKQRLCGELQRHKKYREEISNTCKNREE